MHIQSVGNHLKFNLLDLCAERILRQIIAVRKQRIFSPHKSFAYFLTTAISHNYERGMFNFRVCLFTPLLIGFLSSFRYTKTQISQRSFSLIRLFAIIQYSRVSELI